MASVSATGGRDRAWARPSRLPAARSMAIPARTISSFSQCTPASPPHAAIAPNAASICASSTRGKRRGSVSKVESLKAHAPASINASTSSSGPDGGTVAHRATSTTASRPTSATLAANASRSVTIPSAIGHVDDRGHPARGGGAGGRLDALLRRAAGVHVDVDRPGQHEGIADVELPLGRQRRVGRGHRGHAAVAHGQRRAARLAAGEHQAPAHHQIERHLGDDMHAATTRGYDRGSRARRPRAASRPGIGWLASPSWKEHRSPHGRGSTSSSPTGAS